MGAASLGHFGVLLGAGVGVGEEGDELHLQVVLLHVRLQVFTDLMVVVGKKLERVIKVIIRKTHLLHLHERPGHVRPEHGLAFHFLKLFFSVFEVNSFLLSSPFEGSKESK